MTVYSTTRSIQQLGLGVVSCCDGYRQQPGEGQREAAEQPRKLGQTGGRGHAHGQRRGPHRDHGGPQAPREHRRAAGPARHHCRPSPPDRATCERQHAGCPGHRQQLEDEVGDGACDRRPAQPSARRPVVPAGVSVRTVIVAMAARFVPGVSVRLPLAIESIPSLEGGQPASGSATIDAMPTLRRILAPLTSEVTYRRYVHLVLGATVVLPYLALGWLFVVSADAGGFDPVALVLLLVVAGVSAVVILLFPAMHELAATAARTLLDADIPDRDPVRSRDWGARLRGAWWLLINMTLGILATLLILIVIPMAVGFLIAPWRDFKPLPTGWVAVWAPLVGLALPIALLHAGTAIGGWLRSLAPRLLGPTREERLAAELEAARRVAGELSERNRLARELHDSVGHALTVTAPAGRRGDSSARLGPGVRPPRPRRNRRGWPHRAYRAGPRARPAA